MSNRIWLPEEDAVIRSERAKLTPVPVIAERLGRAVPATYLRARKLRCLVQVKSYWSTEDEARFNKMLLRDPMPTDRELALAFDRSIASVRWKVKHLGFLGRRASGLPPGTRVNRPTKAGSDSERAERAAERQLKAGQSRRMRAVKKQIDHQVVGTERCVAILRRRDDRVQSALFRERDKALLLLARRLIRDQKAGETALKREQKQAERSAMAVARFAAKQEQDLRREADKRQRAADRAQKAALAWKTAPAKQKTPDRPDKSRKSPPDKQGRSVRSDEARPVNHLAPVVDVIAPQVIFDPAVVSKSDVSPPTRTVGRGGWVRKSVIGKVPLPKVRLTRNDALALSTAAKEAVSAFIAKRGVTRTKGDHQHLINKLRARGYVVTSGERGWLIDYRHVVDSVEGLIAFARARGVELESLTATS